MVAVVRAPPCVWEPRRRQPANLLSAKRARPATHPTRQPPHAPPEQRPSQSSSLVGSSRGELPKRTDPETMTLTGAWLAASAPSSHTRCCRPSTSHRLLSSSVCAATEVSRGANLAAVGPLRRRRQAGEGAAAAAAATLAAADAHPHSPRMRGRGDAPGPATPAAPAVGLHEERLGAKGGRGRVAGHLPQRVIAVGGLLGGGVAGQMQA